MIINKEYISIELKHGDGRAELEAFPLDGKVGPVFFRWHGRNDHYGSIVAAVKHYDETWEKFWDRQDSGWVLTPIMRELAETLEKALTEQSS